MAGPGLRRGGGVRSTPSAGVNYDFFQSRIWFRTRQGDETETHYPLGMFVDRFSAGREPGLLLLHGAGNVLTRVLASGERVLLKPTGLLYTDTSIEMRLHLEQPSGTWRSFGSWGERYRRVMLTGPGCVAMRSAYKHFEDPGRTLSCTPAGTTSRPW